MSATKPAPQPELFPEEASPPGVVQVNAQVQVRSSGGRRVVLVRGVPAALFAADDRAGEAHAMVLLLDQGLAQQVELARAFGCSTRTVRRYQARFAEGGLLALARQPGCPPGVVRRQPKRDARIVATRRKGLSNRAVARQFGIDEKTVRKALRRSGWVEARPVQGALDLANASLSAADPNLSASAAGQAAAEAADTPTLPDPGADPNLSASGDLEPLSPCADTDPGDRRYDRALAHHGALHDARPLFASAPRVEDGGVLLAVPALVATGVLDCARQVYGTLGPAFYGLRTTILTLLLMALMRIHRPENLKEQQPAEMGRVLGLDRAPEVKTLRRKLARLAATGKAAELGRALARARARTHGEALGFLYVDGHVRVYHGKHKLPKAHVTRMRISLPATTDYWVNDRDGDPVFVVTAQANAGLVAVLPPLLAEMRPLLGQRRATVVFDRGGWSPALFAQLIDSGFDVLTYRKGRSDPLEQTQFTLREATLDGRVVKYQLADQMIDVALAGKRKLKMRQVTRLSDDGQHQTQILTNRNDLPAVEVAWRMFERWRQENFFKYLRAEYALDALAEYAVEPDDANRTVPNPARRPLDDELRKLKAELNTDECELALWTCVNPASLDNQGLLRMGQQLLDKFHRRNELQAARKAMPARIPIGQAISEPVVRLAPERQLLTNLLKMVAYQAETELFRMLAPHYRRCEDEGRTLVTAALNSTVALEVTDTELRVRLAPQSSPHRTRAVAKLCRQLDAQNVRFPGTRLRLRYEIQGAVDGLDRTD